VHLVLFDIDGTLVNSYDFDSECFQSAVHDVIGVPISQNWSDYRHVTDSGILNQIIDEHGLGQDRTQITHLVKEKFLLNISDYLSEHGVSPIAGAREFLAQLIKRTNVMVAFATGGWQESAIMKLEAAGLHFPSVPIASSSDHYRRMDIMKTAELRAGTAPYKTKTYFGDAPWDLKASSALGYNFILVGNRIEYQKSIKDFTAANDVLAYIGLNPLNSRPNEI
jgi:beta-phosphoglucomutase-like phosphatase (HAD superfamily)